MASNGNNSGALAPFDLVMGVLDTLKPEEQKQIAERLGVLLTPPAPLTACQRNGHKFKAVARTAPSWFTPARTVWMCTACAQRKEF